MDVGNDKRIYLPWDPQMVGSYLYIRSIISTTSFQLSPSPTTQTIFIYLSKKMKRCSCGRIAVIRTSWTDDNPGRRFYSCPFKVKNSNPGFNK